MNPAHIDFAALGLDPDVRLSPHVRLRETVCHCGRCGLWRVSGETLRIFERVRAACNAVRVEMGRPEAGLRITSGARCAAWQARVNPASRCRMHVPRADGHGHALDVAAPTDLPWSRFLSLVRETLREFPAAGLGTYPTRGFVHLDDGYGVAAGRRWIG